MKIRILDKSAGSDTPRTGDFLASSAGPGSGLIDLSEISRENRIPGNPKKGQRAAGCILCHEQRMEVENTGAGDLRDDPVMVGGG
jgi:hypothetical protein